MQKFLDINDLFEAYSGQAVNSADLKPETYVDPNGKTRVRMVPAKRNLTKEAYEDDEKPSPDEMGMAMSQLRFIQYAADEIEDYLEDGAAFPEWFQNKLTKVYSEIQDLHAYMEGENHSEDDEDDEEDEDEE